MDEKMKKTFVIPEATVVSFSNEDIITESANEWATDNNTEFWG